MSVHDAILVALAAAVVSYFLGLFTGLVVVSIKGSSSEG